MYTYKSNKRRYQHYADKIPYSPDINMFALGDDLITPKLQTPQQQIQQAVHNSYANNLNSIANQTTATMDKVSKNFTESGKATYFNSKINNGNSKTVSGEKTSVGQGLSSLGSSLLAAGAGALGNLAGKAISGKRTSEVGNAVGTVGNAVGDVVSYFNPVAGAFVKFGSGVVGGIGNALIGNNTTEYDNQLADTRGIEVQSGDLDAITAQQAATAPALSNVKRSDFGWLNGSTYNSYKQAMANNARYQGNLFTNAIDNTMNDALASQERVSAALGGMINTSSPTGLWMANNQLISQQSNTSHNNEPSIISPIKTFKNGGKLNEGDIAELSEKEIKRLEKQGYVIEKL